MFEASLVLKLADRLHRADTCPEDRAEEKWQLVADTIDLLIESRIKEALGTADAAKESQHDAG